MDIEVLDTDKSPNVGWIRAGEWLTHAGSSVQVYVDNGTTPVATGNVSVLGTLPAGQHRLKLSFPTDFVTINWINFAPRGGV
jgi:hypothetical protein